MTIDIFGRLQRIVEIVEQEGESDSNGKRKKQRNDDVTDALRANRLARQSRLFDLLDVLCPVAGRNLKLFRTLEICLIELFVCLESLGNVSQSDLRRAHTRSVAALAKISLLQLALFLERGLITIL